MYHLIFLDLISGNYPTVGRNISLVVPVIVFKLQFHVPSLGSRLHERYGSLKLRFRTARPHGGALGSPAPLLQSYELTC